MEKIAVIVITYNMAQTLKMCMQSLLNQTVSDFRLIVIDDASSDGTEDVMRNFSDNRICYNRNHKNLGIAASRNKGLANLVNEEMVFFTDADCYVESNWIEEGLKAFDNDSSVIAVDGKTIYGGEGYRPHLAEKSYHKEYTPGMCHTDNCAYRVSVFQKIGYFDEINFDCFLEDTDLFYRAKKAFPDKKFLICPDMKAIHQISFWSIFGFFKDTQKVKYFIKIIKKHGRLDFGAGKLGSFMLSPKNFMLAIFPPLIFVYIFGTRRRITTMYDLAFGVLYIVKAYYYRFLVWYYAIKEKVFVF